MSLTSLESFPYNRDTVCYFVEIERELIPLALEQKIAVIPYNPLAGGLLTGKHSFNIGPTVNTRFTLGSAAERYQERYWHASYFKTVESLQHLTANAGLSLATAAVAWVLAKPAVASVLIGASHPVQLKETLAAADLNLDKQLKQEFDVLTASYRCGDAAR